jgi:hypothetical protein
MSRLTTNSNAAQLTVNSTPNRPSFKRQLLVAGLNLALLAPSLGAPVFASGAVQDGRSVTRTRDDGPRRVRPADDDEMTPLGLKRSELVAKSNPNGKNFSPVSEDQPGSGEYAIESSIRPDIHGTTSVENFQGTQNNLSKTHDSAAGFRNYLSQFHQANFARQDTGVSTWLFHDTSSSNYDIWNDGGIDYGIDAVRAAFHSSHGGLSGNVYRTSMGFNWNSTGWNARSDQMALGGDYWSFGNERLRYMFWDTCNSIMFSGGNSPYTTWGPRAKGIRMIFGYDTTSVDNANYGKYFWEEWNKNKTFKYAFLDASWRIATDQTPVVLAFGATQSEAISRRDGERYLYGGSASNSWGAWSWYNARRSSEARGLDRVAVPEQAVAFESVERNNAAEAVTELSRKIGITLPEASLIQERPFGIKAVTTKGATLIVEPNGNFELTLNRSDAEMQGEAVLEDGELIGRARELAGKLGLSAGYELRQGLVRDLVENSGFEANDGQARVTEKTVIFDQVLNGVPFVDPDAGHLEISFSSRGGQVTRVRNTLHAVRVSQLESAAAPKTLAAARQEAMNAFHAAASVPGGAQAEAEVVAESEQVGYHLVNGKLTLAYRAVIQNRSVPGSRPFLAVISLTEQKTPNNQ